jgi:hypothetical protein
MWLPSRAENFHLDVESGKAFKSACYRLMLRGILHEFGKISAKFTSNTSAYTGNAWRSVNSLLIRPWIL